MRRLLLFAPHVRSSNVSPLLLTCDAVVISTMILGALPCAVALFPQLGSIPAASVEQEFRNLTADDGTKVTTFWYNKGL